MATQPSAIDHDIGTRQEFRCGSIEACKVETIRLPELEQHTYRIGTYVCIYIIQQREGV
jgi:hypothetical protein